MATILCIDDDLRVLETQKSLLEKNGYRVLTAPDGAAGIEMSRKHPIDAVVLDFELAGVDGDEVASVLAREQPNLPVVISCGCRDEVPEAPEMVCSRTIRGRRPARSFAPGSRETDRRLQ
jgi:CheY-like chemotaxis protein